VIMVSHGADLAAAASRVIRLDHGRLAEPAGTPAAVTP